MKNLKGEVSVKAKKGIGKTRAAESRGAVRASISFPHEVHDTLAMIAKEKKVSLAWVVREAVENYIADRWPLLKGQV